MHQRSLVAGRAVQWKVVETTSKGTRQSRLAETGGDRYPDWPIRAEGTHGADRNFPTRGAVLDGILLPSHDMLYVNEGTILAAAVLMLAGAERIAET